MGAHRRAQGTEAGFLYLCGCAGILARNAVGSTEDLYSFARNGVVERAVRNDGSHAAEAPFPPQVGTDNAKEWNSSSADPPIRWRRPGRRQAGAAALSPISTARKPLGGRTRRTILRHRCRVWTKCAAYGVCFGANLPGRCLSRRA